jgi:hypothetical protein
VHATSTADITTFKILINSTLSTEDAVMMMMDIKNYYIGTPLPRFEYMKMLLSRFPKEIIQKYNLNTLAIDGWVHIEIRKGMYGLKQAVLIANQLLQTRLAPFGYYPARHTPWLWMHKTQPISFTLVVDDFAVKYVGKQHAGHLRDALLQTYELTTDWTATVYSGMTLKWDYKNRTCDIDKNQKTTWHLLLHVSPLLQWRLYKHLKHQFDKQSTTQQNLSFPDDAHCGPYARLVLLFAVVGHGTRVRILTMDPSSSVEGVKACTRRGCPGSIWAQKEANGTSTIMRVVSLLPSKNK